MFRWWKKRKRKQVLDQPFPRQWQEVLHQNVWQYRSLTLPMRDKLHAMIKIMVAEKHWEGCEGLTVTDEMRVTISGQSSLMLLGTDDYYFDDVRSVLVFPHAFQRKTFNGLIRDSETRAGEAYLGGPIVLSWQDVLHDAAGSGYNIVVHEFAHHLDGIDGDMGGTPIFDDEGDQKDWAEVMAVEYRELCDAAAQGRWTVLRHYGAKNQAEFFAVASESFFETPERLKAAHSELFELLLRFYRVDPLEWV